MESKAEISIVEIPCIAAEPVTDALYGREVFEHTRRIEWVLDTSDGDQGVKSPGEIRNI